MSNVLCVRAEFEGSYLRYIDLPRPSNERGVLSEVAFLGRSNVGKSSLLNAISQRKKLARSGKTPGVTKAINIFLVEFQSKARRLSLRLVDLPGFGFAKVSLKEQSVWIRELGDYITVRNSLRLVLLLVDARRGIQEAELEIIESLTKPIWIVLTKIDQVSKKDLPKVIESVMESSKIKEIFPVSSANSEGLTELRAAIYSNLR